MRFLPRLTLSVLALVLACAATGAEAALLARLRGAVKIERAGASLPAQEGMPIEDHDVFETEEGAELLLSFDDGSRLAVRPSSRVHLEEVPRETRPVRRMTARMIKGAVRYVSGRSTVQKDVRIITATSTIGVRGTDLEVTFVETSGRVDPGTYLRVNTGEVVMTGRDGATVAVAAGETAIGAFPSLRPRGFGGPVPPALRKIDAPEGVFQRGVMDDLLQ